jgi:hypothetical protein
MHKSQFVWAVFEKTTCSYMYDAPHFPVVKVKYVLHLDVIQLNPGLHSSYQLGIDLEGCTTLGFPKKRARVRSWMH